MRSPGSTSGNAERTPSTGSGWQLIGGSVRGAAHIRANKPNQDAVAWKPLGAPGSTAAAGDRVLEARAMVAALADGHGGERHPRSDRGAQLAVDATLMVLDNFVTGQRGRPPSAVLRAARRTVPRLISRRWRKLIDREAGDEPGGEQRYLAYGATVLAVAVTERYLLYLQLGDGDILAVLPDGSVRRPIAPDPAQASTRQTSSLCQEICDGLFRFAMQPLVDSAAAEIPTLLLLATDGYSNSFESADAILTVAQDLHEKAETHSLEQVRGHLDGWLQETSHTGSGDDITVAVLHRVSLAAAPATAGLATGIASETAAESAPRPLPPPPPPPVAASRPPPLPPPPPSPASGAFALPATAPLATSAGLDQAVPIPPAPDSPERLRQRLARLQIGLGASLGLWVITVIAGLIALSGRQSAAERTPEPAVAVARHQGGPPAPAPAPRTGTNPPPATVPPPGSAPSAAAGSSGPVAVASPRKRSRIGKKKRVRTARQARLGRRTKEAAVTRAGAAAGRAAPAKPVVRTRKPRNRG